MSTELIQDERIQILNDEASSNGDATDKDYVLYWMQNAQRAQFNHALEYAIQQANEHDLPLLTVFGLTDDYPEANLRHYTFMLEGLQETQRALADRKIKMVVQKGSPDEVALELGKRAAAIVTDRSYLRSQRKWRREVAQKATCPFIQVETDVVVPIDLVSDKQEYAARTIRPKIDRHVEDFLIELRTTAVKKSSINLNIESLDLTDIATLLDSLKLDRSVPAVSHFFQGGTSNAKRILRRFIEDKFHNYEQHRNQSQTDDVSHMSKYLHFGQISPVEIALAIRESGAAQEQRDTYLEELIVRRELAANFCYFAADTYDSYSCLPEWAAKTLAEHKEDERIHRYTRSEMERAETHDDYWNAAMREMRYTGYMHNYMRMYWGKKILEWCNTPEYAFQTALYLNNKYFLDGRDHNSYTGVAWVFGIHDRAWTEREIFGKIRYMNAKGLERKMDIKGYVKKVDALVEEAKSAGITFEDAS